MSGGRAVVIRPLATTDEAALAEAFTRLSDTSRRLRFGYVAQAMPAEEQYVEEPDDPSTLVTRPPVMDWRVTG